MIKNSTWYFKNVPQGEKEFRFQYCQRIHEMTIADGRPIKYHSILAAYRTFHNITHHNRNSKTDRLRAYFREHKKPDQMSVEKYLQQCLLESGVDMNLKYAHVVYWRYYDKDSTPRVNHSTAKTNNEIWRDRFLAKSAYPELRESYLETFNKYKCQ